MKLQHVLVSQPEISAVSELAGKRIGAGSFGTLPAYEVRVLIDKYNLGADTVIIPLNSTNDRMIATERGTIDATVVPVPSDLKAEEMGLKRLLQKQKKTNFQRSASGDRADHARTAGNEIDVAAHERHVCHRCGHENQVDVQIFFAKIAFLSGHHHGENGLAECRNSHLHLARLCAAGKTNEKHNVAERRHN